MITLQKSETIILSEGYQEFVIDTQEEAHLVFECTGKSEAFFRIVRAKDITIETRTFEGAEATYLFWNEADVAIKSNEMHKVYRDARLQVSYGEVSQSDMERDIQVDLLEQGAYAHVGSATLTGVKKQYHMTVTSVAEHTEGHIENYGVVITGGKYHVDATGAIGKGAVGSESHQTSRALCFDPDMQATILPKLLIDENDVKASHATSLGRVDEEQMYYMQARGLTPQQCTALISTGYLMPITRTIADETLQNTLREELERKIYELCAI